MVFNIQERLMKEVKKEIQRIETRIHYEAIDGTKFLDKEECIKYEQSARGVLRSRFNSLVVAKHDEWELLRGSDDHTVYVLKLETPEDKDTILQLYYIENPHLIRDDAPASYAQYRAKYEAMVDEALKSKDLLLMGENCDGDLYFIDTRNEFIRRLKVVDQKKDDAEGQNH